MTSRRCLRSCTEACLDIAVRAQHAPLRPQGLPGAFFHAQVSAAARPPTSPASHRHTDPVDRLPVYRLALELQITATELRGFLAKVGWAVRSSADLVAPAAAAAARESFGPRPGGASAADTTTAPATRVARAARRDRDNGWWDGDWWDNNDRWENCPSEVTATEAARLCGAKAATIRQWAARGYLTRVGNRGRSPLYASTQLRRVQSEVADRTRKPPLPRPGLRSRDLDALVPGPEAAALVGVAPSTIRMWVARGHLTPVPQAEGTGRRLFLVSDVLQAARRR